MKVDQISIFLENRAGRLAEVTRTLSDNGINIRGPCPWPTPPTSASCA